MAFREIGLLVFAGVALLLQLSCAATVPAPSEENVRITENATDVKGCQVLGPIEAKGPFKVPDEWKIEFRNQGLQLGADTVVLNHWSLLAQSFSGMAYRCAQAAATETAAPAPAVVPAPTSAPVADGPRVVSAAPPGPPKLGEGDKASDGETHSPDQARVIKAIESMYLAATTDDLDLFHSVTAPDFFAFENGRRFEGDALMQLAKNLHGSGMTYVWSVTEPRVEIFGDTALITYLNRGSVQDASGKKDLTWLESALLRKDNGTWRIRFLHSTRMP